MGFEGLYEVSDQGRVRSLDRWIQARGSCGRAGYSYLRKGRVMRQYRPSGRYASVRLYSSERDQTCEIHRLVTAAFIGPQPEGQWVRHVDGNAHNNVLANLAYGSPQENIDDKQRHGTQTKGETHGTRKLCEAEALAVRAARESSADIAARYGITACQVNRIKARTSWKHV